MDWWSLFARSWAIYGLLSVVRSRSGPGSSSVDLWPVYGSFSVRLRFVFGASSKAGIGPVCVRDGFRPRLDARFMVYWTPV